MNTKFLNTALMGGIGCALLVTALTQTLSAQTSPGAKPASSTDSAASPHYRATYSANSYLQSEEDAGCALLVTALTQTLSAQTSPAAKPASSTDSAASPHYRATYSANSYLQSEEDSSVKPVQTIITYVNGPTYHLRMAGDKVIELFVNDRKIPADSFYVYDNLTKKLALQIKADRQQALVDKQQAERDQLQATQDKLQAERDQLQAKEDRLQAERDRQEAKLDAEQAMQDKLQAEKDQAEARIEQVAAEQEREAEARERAQDREQAVEDREQALRDRAQAGEDRKQAERDRKQAAEDRAILKKLISEVIREGLVPDEKSLHSLSLDEDGLFINGKQQPDALKKTMLENLGIKGSYHVNYSRDSRQITR